MQKESIISKKFVILFIFSVLICTGMNMLNVIVPLYVTVNLHQTTAMAGWMTTIYTIAACASRPINGVLTDTLGRRVVMLCGAMLFGAACLICGMIPAVSVLVVCRVLMGIGYSAATTANNTASTDVIPSSRLAEGIGYFGMSQSLASAVGPAVASIVISNLGNQTALFFDGAIAAISLVIALFIGEESKSTVQKPTAGLRRKSGFFEPSALVPAIYQGLSLFLISCMMCFMTLYIVSRGLSSHVAGSFFVVASVAIVGVRLCFSKWMNRFAAVVFLIPGYLLLFLVCILLPYAKSSIMFLVCGLVYGMAHGTIWMTLGSEAVRFAPAKRRGASNATFYFAFDAAIGIGAAFWGAMIDKIGYVRCFYLIAIGSLLLMLGAIPTFRRRSTKYQTIIQQ